MALPSLVRVPVQLTLGLASGGVKLLLRPLGLLHHGGGEQAAPAAEPVRTPDPQVADAPATNPTARQAEPVRSAEEERTVGRRSHERKEPTPEPAQGASAAQAGSRRASAPKAGRAVRKRKVAADTIDTVATGPGS